MRREICLPFLKVLRYLSYLDLDGEAWEGMQGGVTWYCGDTAVADGVADERGWNIGEVAECR